MVLRDTKRPKHPLFERDAYTIGDLYAAVFAIHDSTEAQAFYEDYVVHNMEHARDQQYRTTEGAAALAKSNIGWIFGEGMPKADIIMWTEVCGASHPKIGTAILRVTPEQAFQIGVDRAKDG